MRADADAEAARMRRETDDYVDAKLANFEVALHKTIAAVQKGRDKIRGRHDYDELGDPVDDTPLPARSADPVAAGATAPAAPGSRFGTRRRAPVSWRVGRHEAVLHRARPRKAYLLTTIDPRSPLVLDTRELGRRAGSMQEVSLTVPAPADLGIMSIGVPEGSEIELDLRLESVIEGVLVSGTALVQLTGECSRCLDPISDELEVDLQELYALRGDRRTGRPVAHRRSRRRTDDEQLHLVGDHLDLEPVLRDAVVLDLPLAPVCRDDCPGLCPQCGFRLADDPTHDHDVIDPRWAALSGWKRSVTDDDIDKEEG